MAVSQKLERIQSQIWNFWKFIQISSKQRSFLHTLPTWVHGTGFHPLQPQMQLLASVATSGSRRSKVNNELRKVLNLLFFLYFFYKWADTFTKLQFDF